MKRILADESVPGVSIRLLQEWEFDVEAVATALPGARDEDVLDLAREQARLLLTFDRDFGELIYRRGLEARPSVIYLRLVPTGPEEAAALLRRLFDHPEIQLEGRFSVVTRDQVRQRPLP